MAQAPIFFALFTVLNGIAAKTDAGVPAPIARGFLKGEYLDSAAQATFFGAKISESFLRFTRYNGKDRNSYFDFHYVCYNFYNTTPVDGKGNAKDGFQQQYDVATAENHVVFIPSNFRGIWR